MAYRVADNSLIGGIAFDTDEIIGDGGWTTRLDAADDGTMVSGTDACGPRIRRAGERKWRKLFMPGINAPMADYAHQAQGTYDVAICATDSDVVYFITGWNLWKTADGGATVTLTALTDINGQSNENTRMTGKQLAVDPENPDVVFAGTPSGLYYSSNGGSSFSLISTGTIPAPLLSGDNQSRQIVCFDRTSAVSGGKTQGIYVFVTKASGSGLYRSTNGGSSWSNVSGGPSSAAHMRVSPHDGFVHLAGNGTNGGESAQYRRWDTSSWIAPTDVVGKALAVSPHTAGHIHMVNDGSYLASSPDNGVNWWPYAVPTRRAVDIPWVEWAEESYMSNGDIIFDGLVNRLWLAEGITTWELNNPPTTNVASIEWLEAGVGRESMVSNPMDVDPNGRVLYACHDRRGFAIERADVGRIYPSIHARGPGPASILHGGNIAYAPDDYDTLFIPLAYTGASHRGGKSVDGGRSWIDMPGDVREASAKGDPLEIGPGGGVIAALSSQVIVQREKNNGMVLWSKDGGTTWVKLIIGGDYDSYYAFQAYWVASRPLIADKYVTNQAWLYLVGNGNGDAEDLSYRGVWRLNYDPGTEILTPTRVKGPSSPYITGYNADYWHVRFAQIGVNDFLFCGGDNCVGLWRSTDGMVTWNYIVGTDDVNVGAAGFGEVFGVAVGAGRVSGEKTIIAAGWRENSPIAHSPTYDGLGVWMSEGVPATTLGQTWVRLEQVINGGSIFPQEVAADPEIYGLFYAGLVSEGVARIRYQDKRAWS